jgi:hypothetical protein
LRTPASGKTAGLLSVSGSPARRAILSRRRCLRIYPIPYALETDWLAGETLGMDEPSFNPEMLRQKKPDIPCRNDWTSAANRASVPSIDEAIFLVLDPAPLAIAPLWGFGSDGTCAVATERI